MTKTEWKALRGSSPEPDQIMLSMRGDPAKQMAVRWRVSPDVTTGYALFRPVGAGEWTRVDAVPVDFETDLDENRFFFCDLKPLSPETEYEYTVGDDAHRSPVCRFRSLKENPSRFSFIVVADIQTGGPEPPADYAFVGDFLKQTLQKHPEADFILTAGDNTNCGQTDVQWTGLFNGLKGISESIPIMFAMGNHDDMGFEDYFTFTGKYYSEHATYFTNMLRHSYNENGPAGWQVANYAFDYGDTHFCVLGTSGYDEMNAWLLDEMTRTDKTWKIAVHHFPVCYAGPTIENADTWPSLKTGMDRCDLVFSGHEHSFARSYPRRGDGLYDRPSQGAVHYNVGSGARNPPGTRVVPKVWNAKTYCHEEELSMYTLVDVDGPRLRLRAFTEDGRLVDDCVIDKEKDLITPVDPAPVYNRPRLKYKGYDLGMCGEHLLPVKLGGLWYVCPGAVMSFTGGTTVRGPGRIRAEIYGRFAEFTENSSVMWTKDGEHEMAGPCLRLSEGQLFVPVADFCRPLRMYPLYFEHNNFLSIESDTEARPVPLQP
ncbi:MAG: metallophosphoesterase family protein [Clostridia bacterium]|nr:metallophosphoesterase family protein [Clostridia bacterium]